MNKEQEKLTDDEIKTLREANQALVEQLKRLTVAVHGIQIGPMCDGISKLISTNNQSVMLIRRFDSQFDPLNELKLPLNLSKQ